MVTNLKRNECSLFIAAFLFQRKSEDANYSPLIWLLYVIRMQYKNTIVMHGFLSLELCETTRFYTERSYQKLDSQTSKKPQLGTIWILFFIIVITLLYFNNDTIPLIHNLRCNKLSMFAFKCTMHAQCMHKGWNCHI